MWFFKKNNAKQDELEREIVALKHKLSVMETNLLSMRNKVNKKYGSLEDPGKETGASTSLDPAKLTPEMQSFVAGLPEWDRQKLLSGEYHGD